MLSAFDNYLNKEYAMGFGWYGTIDEFLQDTTNALFEDLRSDFWVKQGVEADRNSNGNVPLIPTTMLNELLDLLRPN